MWNLFFFLASCIDTNALLENTPLVNFIRNHIRDSSSVFFISSLVKISMISLILSLLNCTQIRWCMIKISSGLPRKSSEIFGNFRKFRENVGKRSSCLRNNFGKSSKIIGKWSEIFRKLLKCRHQYVYLK